jgi:hypothetical protein
VASEPVDKSGRPVKVGSKVRILGLSESFLGRLPGDEVEDVRSMIGEILEVYEIDDYGSPWVKKWWRLPGGRSFSHSLALASSETEVVDEAAL